GERARGRWRCPWPRPAGAAGDHGDRDPDGPHRLRYLLRAALVADRASRLVLSRHSLRRGGSAVPGVLPAAAGPGLPGYRLRRPFRAVLADVEAGLARQRRGDHRADREALFLRVRYDPNGSGAV